VSAQDITEALVQGLLGTVREKNHVEIAVLEVIDLLQKELSTTPLLAQEAWEGVSGDFRKILVREGYTIQWNFIRGVVIVERMPRIEELQGIGEIYQRATPAEVARKIRLLTGVEFERYLAAVLSRRSEFRNITLTPGSGDGGIDFTGYYINSTMGREFPLVGQAKQWSVPIPVGVAREFIGTMALTPGSGLMGIMIGTSGFTASAAEALDSSKLSITRWDMTELLRMSHGIATKQIEVSFSVPDDTFWGEILG
jgi:hypothetical protein